MVVNTWDQHRLAGGDRIYISYVARHSVVSGRWLVHRAVAGRECVTDKGAAWYDHGRKSFSVYMGKKEGLQDALAWVKATYNKEDFVRNRMGDYVEREVNKKFPIPKREAE